MLRVALVITELEVGGAERCLTNLALGLDRTRFEPVVYSLAPRPRDERAALVRQLEAAGVPIHFLGLTHASQFFRGVRKLADLLRAQRADVVQTFLFHANVLGTRAAKQAGIEQVCTGIRVADPRWTRGLVERIATRRASRFVCVSQGVADQCRRRGFDAQKLVVIHNGIDLERWKNARPADLTQFGVRPGRPVLVYVGRLDRQKGVERMVQDIAISEFFVEAELLIVGDGPRRGAAERLAQKMSAHHIHFAGWQADVPGILAASDVLVLFSRWEGMPNVILEAMAAGKPVWTTPVEGAEELLGGGFAEQTPTLEFRKRVRNMLRNNQIRKDLGRRNQLRAEQFSLPRMVGRYADLYESLVRSDK
jgi:glycosyltransferase involved in cell wall biosynthesis